MSSEVIQLANGQVIDDRRNGNGYRMYLPEHASSEIELEHFASDQIRFAEMRQIISQAALRSSVLVTGEPGSGKTNLISDMEAGCQANAIPSLRLSLHLNAGKLSRLGHTRVLLDTYVEQTSASPALLIIDNADYVGYRSRSRSRTNARSYATAIAPALINAMNASHVVTVGTAHNHDWQRTHWTWNDPDIEAAQDMLLDNFAGEHLFEGELGLRGLETEISRRLGADSPVFGPVLSILGEMRADFHLAHHVDTGLLLSDQEAAIRQVMLGRELKMRPAST